MSRSGPSFAKRTRMKIELRRDPLSPVPANEHFLSESQDTSLCSMAL